MDSLNTMFKRKSNVLCNNKLFNIDTILCIEMHETMRRLYEAAEKLKGITGQSELARCLNTSPQTVNNWEARGMSLKGILEAEKIIGCRAVWLETGIGHMASDSKVARFSLKQHDEFVEDVGKIEYWDVKGSCGGGFLNYDQLPKGHLVKEAKFFKKFDLKPGDAFAIYADGDSMAEFIVDGDIVIFDKTKTEPISGKIFAIEHPDGLRIKVLRRMIDGSWILESKNADKARYPDEVIPPGHAELLKIHGQFVYRQGG